MSTPIPPHLSVPVGDANVGSITLFVGEGTHVLKYQKLAMLNTALQTDSGVPVHAPTSGVISSIGFAQVADHTEQEQFCINITTDGEDTPLQLAPSADYLQLSASALISRIRDAGIIGMGGAGFPTAQKLASSTERSIQLLIINAAECEPYISADEALIRERADKVAIGAQILMRASGAQRCVIAIEDSKPDAIRALELVLQDGEQLCELVIIPSKYPAGSERHLIQCVTGREIAADLHPPEEGILVHNSGTAHAVYQAVVERRPCISRITTLCGEALKTPKNFEALIGTPAEYLFNLCGIDKSRKQKTILGGPLMGNELRSDSASVAKTTNCLIAASATEVTPAETEQACIRCGYCADICPVRLLPQQLLAYGRAAESEQLLAHGLLDCVECGACDYVCPSHIQLVSTFQQSKDVIGSRRLSMERSQHWQQRFQFHQYRIKKEKDQAQSRKPHPAKVAAETRTVAEDKLNITKKISKQQASKDIAAAVARVKARRENKNE